MKPRPILAIAAFCLATAATAVLAHSGVKNKAVMARMTAMGEIKDAVATLGDMAKGVAPYEANTAKAARDRLIVLAKTAPALFETPASDPKSEALPVIWENWADFSAKADAMTQAAQTIDTSSRGAIGASLGRVGAACSGCHETYRVKK